MREYGPIYQKWYIVTCTRTWPLYTRQIMTNIRPDRDSCMQYYMIHNVSLDMKRCICHSVKWQMHPLISKGAIYRSSWLAYRYVSMSTFMTISVTVGIDWPLWARYYSQIMMRYHTRLAASRVIYKIYHRDTLRRGRGGGGWMMS